MARHIILFFLFTTASILAKGSDIDTLDLLRKIAPLDNGEKERYLFDYANSFEISDPVYALKVIHWLEKQPFFTMAAKSGYILRKAILLKNSDDHQLAISLFNKAFAHAKNENDTLNMAAIMLKLSDTYDELTQPREMVTAARKSLHYYSMLRDSIYMVRCYLKIITANKNTESYSVLSRQLKGLLPLCGNNNALKGVIYSTLANVFEGNKVYDSSLYYNRHFLNNIPEENEPDKFVALYNIGQNLLDLKKKEESKAYFLQANKLNEQLKIDVYDRYIKLKLAEVELELGNAEASEKYRMNINKETLNDEQLLQYYKVEHLYLKKTGDYRSALAALENYKQLSDSLNNKESLKVISEIKLNYDFEKKEEEVAALEKINSLKGKQIRTQRTGLALLGLLLVTLSFLLYKVVRQKKTITRNNDLITKTLKEKDLLVKEIHHRVKNNLQVVSSLLNLQSEYITDAAAFDAINTGKSRVASMALIHQNLYKHDHLTTIETRPYFEDLIEQIFDTYNTKENVKINTVIDNLLLDAEVMLPLGLVINELLTNALKHAFTQKKNGAVDFVLKDNGNNIFISVKDDGDGMNIEAFRQSNTFGNKMIEIFLQKLNTKLAVTSGSGTRFSFEIKKTTLQNSQAN